MKRIRVSRRAERDLDSIWTHVAAGANSFDVADHVIDAIVANFAMLARQPRAGRRREDIDPGVRSFVSGAYLIYYRETRSHVVISRILHGKRDQLAAWIKTETR